MFQSILKLLKSIAKPENSGLLSDADNVNTPGGTDHQSSTMTILRIVRGTLTKDGVFGLMTINGDTVCETVENRGKEIAEGLYDAVIDRSPHLGYLCPHIRVPLRDQAAGGDAGIRIHILNLPCQSEGCIGTCVSRDGDAGDNSRLAFRSMMALLPPPGTAFKVLVYAVH